MIRAHREPCESVASANPPSLPLRARPFLSPSLASARRWIDDRRSARCTPRHHPPPLVPSARCAAWMQGPRHFDGFSRRDLLRATPYCSPLPQPHFRPSTRPFHPFHPRAPSATLSVVTARGGRTRADAREFGRRAVDARRRRAHRCGLRRFPVILIDHSGRPPPTEIGIDYIIGGRLKTRTGKLRRCLFRE